MFHQPLVMGGKFANLTMDPRKVFIYMYLFAGFECFNAHILLTHLVLI